VGAIAIANAALLLPHSTRGIEKEIMIARVHSKEVIGNLEPDFAK
jgi:hypothetical protein